jgi:hypothetical protein
VTVLQKEIELLVSRIPTSLMSPCLAPCFSLLRTLSTNNTGKHTASNPKVRKTNISNMTVSTTDYHQKRRGLPSFGGMIRSRSNRNGSLMKHHRLPDNNATDDDSTSSTMSAGRNNNISSDAFFSDCPEKVPPAPPLVPPLPDAAPTPLHSSETEEAPEAEETLAPATEAKKQVRFNEEQNQVHEQINNNSFTANQNSMMMMIMFNLQDEECIPPRKEELWYGPTEYRHFKTSTLKFAREIALSEQLNKAPCSYQRVMLRTYKTCCQCNEEPDENTETTTTTETEIITSTTVGVLTEQEARHLKRWMDVSTSRLGVEKLSLRHLARDRIHKRKEMMQLVFEIQEMTTSNSSDIDDIDDLKAEFIRNTCLAISRGSRLFAMHMAIALAASIHHH